MDPKIPDKLRIFIDQNKDLFASQSQNHTFGTGSDLLASGSSNNQRFNNDGYGHNEMTNEFLMQDNTQSTGNSSFPILSIQTSQIDHHQNNSQLDRFELAPHSGSQSLPSLNLIRIPTLGVLPHNFDAYTIDELNSRAGLHHDTDEIRSNHSDKDLQNVAFEINRILEGNSSQSTGISQVFRNQDLHNTLNQDQLASLSQPLMDITESSSSHQFSHDLYPLDLFTQFIQQNDFQMLSQQSSSLNQAFPNHDPIRINPKQLNRILKRRAAKRAYEEKMGLSSSVVSQQSDQQEQQSRPNTHQSRREHAMKRVRSRTGRFLSSKEKPASQEGVSVDQVKTHIS